MWSERIKRASYEWSTMRGQLRRIWVIVTLFAAYFGVQLFSNSAWATEQRILFGINEVAMPTDMKNLKMLSSWVRMLDRHTRDENRRDAPCVPATSQAACAISEWLNFIDREKSDDKTHQLQKINVHLNLHRYILDIVNYGIVDYWATPREFAINDGDCEDFAIAKYITLRKLGWSPMDLRIVVLNDLNLRIGHAILVVYVDEKAYVLDNQIKQIVEAGVIRHYRPVYSVNEERSWIYATPFRINDILKTN